MSVPIRLPTLLVRTTLSIMACTVLFAGTGCSLPHARLQHARLLPAKYCPGDTLTASYTILECVSHSGLDCAAIAPTVNVTSSSAALPSYSFTAHRDSRTFSPTEDSVLLTFNPTPSDPQSILVPYRDAMGVNHILSYTLAPETRRAERIADGTTELLNHGGMCNGSTPVNAPVTLPGDRALSERLVAEQVCNSNSIVIFVNATSGSGGTTTRMLAPGECLALGFPATGSVISVRSTVLSPDTQCRATQGMTPPPTLQTRVSYRCGN